MRFTFTLDSTNPSVTAKFWAQALGYSSPGAFGVFWPLVPADVSEPPLVIQHVSEPRHGKNRMHLDLHVPELEAEVERLVSLGATRVSEEIREHDRRWVVPGDPEGNELGSRRTARRAGGGALAAPSPEEIRRFYDRYFQTWNDHDREGFIQLWKDFVTDVSAEDPVGAPPRRGFEEVVVGPWDLMNSTVSMHLEELIVCGNEAAMVVRNEVAIGADTVTGHSIETMRYADDGSVLLRNWWEPQGDMLDSYAKGEA